MNAKASTPIRIGHVCMLIAILFAQSKSALSNDVLPEPLPGPDMLEQVVQLEHNNASACVLLNTGKVFCWRNTLTGVDYIDLPANEAGYESINTTLNNDIAAITLSNTQLCGIGNTKGVACMYFGASGNDSNPGLDNPPEPDAQYLAMSSISDADSTICAIQTDGRTVCWGADADINHIPAGAHYLKQVDVFSGSACGVDLTGSVICWGKPVAQFGDKDPGSIKNAKQVSLGEFGACIIDADDKLQCFGGMTEYTDAFKARKFRWINVQSRYVENRKPLLCYKYDTGAGGCRYTSYYMGSIGHGSIIPNVGKAKHVSWNGKSCVITTDNGMSCIETFYSPIQQFPSAPENLYMMDFPGTTDVQLFWNQPSTNGDDSDYATGYEIYRNNQLIDRIGRVNTYFDDNVSGDTNYEVRAIRGKIAGYSSFVSAPADIPETNEEEEQSDSDQDQQIVSDDDQQQNQQSELTITPTENNGGTGAGSGLFLLLVFMLGSRRFRQRIV